MLKINVKKHEAKNLTLKSDIKNMVLVFDQQMDAVCTRIFNEIIKPFCEKHKISINAAMGTVVYAKNHADGWDNVGEYQYVTDLENRLCKILENIPGHFEQDVFCIMCDILWRASGKKSTQYDFEQGF